MIIIVLFVIIGMIYLGLKVVQFSRDLDKANEILQHLNDDTTKCSHEEWDCDTQIRTIKCRKCGKKAWIVDYTDLYKN